MQHSIMTRAFFLAILIGIIAPAAFAAQPKGDAEAKRAAEEEEAEKSLNGEDSKKTPILHGKVALTPPDPEKKTDVIGTFTVGPQQYQLKIAQQDLRDALAKYDGKEVSLQGKIRNDGKYFVVLSIFGGAGAPPVQLRNPEGL